MYSEFPTDLQAEIDSQSQDQIRVRLANRNKDIESLYRSGSSPCQISEILMISPDTVKTRIARLEEDDEETREFLATGQMPSNGGYVSVFR
jgi:DNA-binding NarL/FixJ family response regulator